MRPGRPAWVGPDASVFVFVFAFAFVRTPDSTERRTQLNSNQLTLTKLPPVEVAKVT